jgi:glycine/D-amino acid oxidase-like deaminating enzyme
LNSYPYWWDTVHDRRTWAHDAGTREADGIWDVAVVGSGYTGLAAALRLARAGALVVVLESESVGWGASSRNGGQVLTGLKLEPAALVSRFGEAGARDLYEASRQSIAALESLLRDESIDCEYERTGHILAAAKPAHFADFRDEQQLLARVFEHHVRLVEPTAQASEIGTRAYHGLLVDESSAAINPAQYVQGLAAAAARAGAVIREHAAAEALSRVGTEWIVRTTAGEVRAKDVFVATNGYTGGATPALRRRLIPIGSYIIATPPLPAAVASRLLPRRRVAFDSRNFLHYFRLTADNRLLFGGRAEFSGPTLESAARATSILQRGMTTIFPELAGTEIDYAWSGHVAFTRDQLPHAGQMGGLYYAAGYCGHGIAMATTLGGLMARRIAGERVEHPLLDRPFPAVPLYDGRPWFLPLVGAYYRFRDWIG